MYIYRLKAFKGDEFKGRMEPLFGTVFNIMYIYVVIEFYLIDIFNVGNYILRFFPFFIALIKLNAFQKDIS